MTRTPPHPDCKDKKSTHYFMCHMTQKEFGELQKRPTKPYKLNTINRVKITP